MRLPLALLAASISVLWFGSPEAAAQMGPGRYGAAVVPNGASIAPAGYGQGAGLAAPALSGAYGSYRYARHQAANPSYRYEAYAHSYRATGELTPPDPPEPSPSPASDVTEPTPQPAEGSAEETLREAVRETRHAAAFAARVVTTVHPAIRVADYLGLIDRHAIVRRIRGD